MVFYSFECKAELQKRVGYQQRIAHELEPHLKRLLTRDGALKAAPRTYSGRLNEEADLAFSTSKTDRRIYIESEFRPNVEKDLVKFQIGWNAQLLGVALLVLAINPREINPAC